MCFGHRLSVQMMKNNYSFMSLFISPSNSAQNQIFQKQQLRYFALAINQKVYWKMKNVILKIGHNWIS